MRLATPLVAIATAAMLLTSAPAHADDAPTHPEVAAMLQQIPGGTAIDYYNAYWPTLDMKMTVPNPLMRAVGTCATSNICAFTSSSMQGTKLSWGTCSTHAIPTGFNAKSVANARGAGSVAQARSGSSIVASVSAGGWKNVNGIDNVRCLE